MIPIEVGTNPNCGGCDYQVFQEMGPARSIKKMRLSQGGREKLFWVTGMDEEGKPCSAFAQRVADSGGGVSFLVFGGKWGIRFKPEDRYQEPWDVQNPAQWGEPFKFYGEEADIFYEE